VFFDHYERITERPIEAIGDWMREGADLNRIIVPGLGEDLQALKEGRSVLDPLTRAPVHAQRFVLFETQFGRRHAASGGHIDFLVWLDIPLDIALARKMRQLAGEATAARDGRKTEEFVAWLQTYLDNYVAVVGRLLRLQRDTVAADADLVLDGTLAPAVLREQAAQAILARFG
jgi:uridine kinase